MLTPQVGLEPTTLRLTAECSAIELLRIVTPARMKYPARAWDFIAEGSRGCQTAVPACAGGAVWGIIWVRKPVAPARARRRRAHLCRGGVDLDGASHHFVAQPGPGDGDAARGLRARGL